MRFGELLQKDAPGWEKHLPAVKIEECDQCSCPIVKVTVGKEAPHPNTLEHYITCIQLLGVHKRSRQLSHIATFNFTPTISFPVVSVHVNIDEFAGIFVLVFCNIHGGWEEFVALE